MLLFVTTLLGASIALAQADEKQGESGSVSPRFAAMSTEAAFVCGEFLPNQIEGITELMPLCGARAGFKMGKKTFMEGQLVGGSARAQRYILGSFSFRGDLQVDDIVGSFYGGPDIHYATSPTYGTSGANGEQTKMYFGVHIGGAVWWEFTDNLFLRTDLQFNLNPGTSLFVGFSLVLRFGAGGGDGGGPGQ